MPKVSVIVPIYNVEDYLDKCLTSLVNQTISDIEVILVNDGTKDKSDIIAKNYAKKHSNFKYYEKENGGLSDARNYGMKYATGEYIAFLDSDDYVHVTLYEKLYNKAKENDYDMVECDFTWIFPNRTRVDKRIPYDIDNSLVNIRVVAWNKLIRRSIIEDNKILFPIGLRYEDITFTYSLLPFLNNIGYVNEALIYYIQRSNSISNTQNEKTRDVYINLNNVINFYKKHDLYDKNKDELEYIFIRYLMGSSYLRVINIKDKIIRRKVLDEGWKLLKTTFPKWKRNKYLYKIRSLKNVYYICTNYFVYIYCSNILKFILR